MSATFVTENNTGYYILDIPAPNNDLCDNRDNSVVALCRTRKKSVSTSAPLYADMQVQVYRRDLYIDLPRGEEKCLPPE